MRLKNGAPEGNASRPIDNLIVLIASAQARPHAPPPFVLIASAQARRRRLSYFFTTTLPNGAKLAWAILKQAIPHGIPIIVQHQRTPVRAAPSASQKPAKTIHIRFSKAVPIPALGEGISFFPNGQNANPAILKLAIPNGMPMIVQHQSRSTRSLCTPPYHS